MELLSGVIKVLTERWEWILEATISHLLLSGIAILIAGVLGLLFGILISEYRALAPAVMGVCNVFYTIPSISLLGFLIPFLGIGNKTAITAIVIYGLMPMVRNTYTGLTTVDKDILEAAKGMGSTSLQILWRIRLPLALPVIMAGIRNMVVMTLSVAAIAAFIGADGLGVVIYRGISVYNSAITLVGSALVAILAFLADFSLGRLEKRLNRWGSK
ncbi:MAG: ABC transporter permease [Eubacteriales bacterium]|nr:ABC transporter permease [Eubacteriales bacterium]